MPDGMTVTGPLVKASIGVQGGIKALNNESLANAGLTMKVERNGTFAQMGVGTGGVNTADVEIGHGFNWGNWGLDLSATAQRNESRCSAPTAPIVQEYDAYKPYIIDGDYGHQVIKTTIQSEYRPSNVMVGGKVKGSYKLNDRVKFNASVETGAVINTGKTEGSITTAQRIVDNPFVYDGWFYEQTTEFVTGDDRTPRLYVKPGVGAEINVDKKGKCTVKPEVDLYNGKVEGKVGIVYNL